MTQSGDLPFWVIFGKIGKEGRGLSKELLNPSLPTPLTTSPPSPLPTVLYCANNLMEWICHNIWPPCASKFGRNPWHRVVCSEGMAMYLLLIVFYQIL